MFHCLVNPIQRLVLFVTDCSEIGVNDRFGNQIYRHQVGIPLCHTVFSLQLMRGRLCFCLYSMVLVRILGWVVMYSLDLMVDLRLNHLVGVRGFRFPVDHRLDLLQYSRSEVECPCLLRPELMFEYGLCFLFDVDVLTYRY